MLSKIKGLQGTVFAGLLLSVLLAGCSVLAGLGIGDSARSSPNLPDPPTIPQLTANDPAARAAELDNLIASAMNEDERLAAWLAVYQAVGIPVIGEDGTPLTNTGDDLVGPPYWLVWYFSGMDQPGRGISLADASMVLTIGEDGTYDPGAGKGLLLDLQSAAHSTDPQLQLLSLFVRERLWRLAPGADFMAPQAAPETITIDAATVYLLSWPLVRQVLYEIALAGGPTSSLHRASLVQRVSNPLPLSETGSCGDSFSTPSIETTAIESIGKKVLFGVKSPQIGFFKKLVKIPGVYERIVQEVFSGDSVVPLDQLAPADKAQVVTKLISWISGIGKAMSLVAQINALELNIVSPQPLTRTHDKTPGETLAVQFRLSFNPEKLKNSKQWDCFVRFIGIGVGYKLPDAKPIPGAVVAIQQGHNMPLKVTIQGNLNPASSSWGGGYEYTTDSGGMITVTFEGAAQQRIFPESSPAEHDTYSVHIRAQPQAITGSSLVDQFLEGFMKPGLPTVGSLVNTVGKMTFDMGEFKLDLIDWGSRAYKASGGMNGTFCRSAQSTLTSDLGETYDFYPGAWPVGQVGYRYDDDGGCSLTGKGSYKADLDEAEQSGTVTVTIPGGTISCTEGPDTPFPAAKGSFTITADPDASCEE